MNQRPHQKTHTDGQKKKKKGILKDTPYHISLGKCRLKQQ